MDLKASSLASFSLTLLVLATAGNAFNVTNVLKEFPQFGAMNDLLSRTELAGPINNRLTITVLAVDNSSLSSISGRDMDEIKNILMNHVILDYYDDVKLGKLKSKSTIVTTFFQTTGLGEKQDGFLNVTKTPFGKVRFGSAVKGSPVISEYVKTVYRQAYNLSVIQVSMPIVSPMFGQVLQAPPPPPASPPPPAPVQAEGPAQEEDVFPPEMAPSYSPEIAPELAPTKGKRKMEDADADEVESSGASMIRSSIVVAGAVIGLVASFTGF